MKFIRRILFLALLMTITIVMFQNQESLGEPLEFSFLYWHSSLVLGFWILIAFATGVALFALVDAWRGILLRLEIRRKEQEILKLKDELAQAQASARTKSQTPEQGASPPSFPLEAETE